MTLITITLDEEEQEIILRHAAYETAGDPAYREFASIADKISRAQDTSPFEIHPPEDGHQRLEAMRRMFQEET